MKRIQTWLATKLPNLFQLKESGICYLRVKPRKQKQTLQFSEVGREYLRVADRRKVL
jgi:hypothetical protein